MFCATRLTLGEYRRVFHQPQFIGGVFITLVGESLHGPPDGLIVHQTKPTNV
jgi:hypothetical protein